MFKRSSLGNMIGWEVYSGKRLWLTPAEGGPRSWTRDLQLAGGAQVNWWPYTVGVHFPFCLLGSRFSWVVRCIVCFFRWYLLRSYFCFFSFFRGMFLLSDVFFIFLSYPQLPSSMFWHVFFILFYSSSVNTLCACKSI